MDYSRHYIAVLRGSPVLRLLMMMRISITATDKMQAEVARTLGLSKWQVARHISFPQAMKIAKPVYQSFIVNVIPQL